MSEPTLSDSERMTILGQVLKPNIKIPEVKETVVAADLKSSVGTCECGHIHSGKCINKYCTCIEAKLPESKLEDFGSLLEQSLAKRQAIVESETKEVDGVREKVLEKVNTDFIKNWRF